MAQKAPPRGHRRSAESDQDTATPEPLSVNREGLKYNRTGRRPMGDTNPVTVRFENSQPILRVENIETSLRFYVGMLGFKNAEWGSGDFTCIYRDGACMYL